MSSSLNRALGFAGVYAAVISVLGIIFLPEALVIFTTISPMGPFFCCIYLGIAEWRDRERARTQKGILKKIKSGLLEEKDLGSGVVEALFKEDLIDLYVEDGSIKVRLTRLGQSKILES